MSYCVNCGVELEQGCGECPLCDTPVINPREFHNKPEKPAYPEIIKIPKSTHKRFLVFVVSMVLLIPNIVLAFLDMFLWGSGISAFIFGGTALVWFWFLFPMLWKKPIPIILLQIDALALLGYLYIFRGISNESRWFEGLAIPIVIAFWAVAAVFILWSRKPRNKSYTGIAATVAVIVLSYIIEICIDMFVFGRLQLGVSFAVTACCIPIIIFFIVLAKSRKLRAWVSRKFFM